MKYRILIILLILITGCVQVINEQHAGYKRLKINTFLTTSGFDTFVYDPNGFFGVGNYKGIPHDVKASYDIKTQLVGIEAESKGE
jgi:hypothetical protein